MLRQVGAEGKEEAAVELGRFQALAACSAAVALEAAESAAEAVRGWC